MWHEIDKKKKALKLKKWKTQKSEHEQASTKHPFRLIPLYHYDPRRWRKDSIVETDIANFNYGGWEFPFGDVATDTNAGLFIGFKMYTPLGYRPLDAKLPNMLKYYDRCQRENIPIVNHCSAGGMLTHEQRFYKDYIEKGIWHVSKSQPATSAFAPDATSGYRVAVQGNENTISVPSSEQLSPEEEEWIANDWFLRNYVHPKAWRNVLDKFPNLHLCLAHFGGDDWEVGPSRCDWIQEIINMLSEKGASGTPKYPNLFTDISCFAIDKNMPNFISEMTRRPEIWDKVMFGTDWYMPLVIPGFNHKAYNDFCRAMKEKLDMIDNSFWIRATFLNPVRFYGLDNRLKLGKMRDRLMVAIKNANLSSDILDSNYTKLLKATDEIENIKKAL